jgi:peptidoglycan/LPS O-acetylase OafA/YrhL
VSGASALGQSIEGGRRYEALDGLRGVAALGVLLYHLGGWTYRPWLMAHGYLAVDFFFCLSGFVLAHAYGTREIGWLGFMRARLVRVWPLIALSMVAGALVMIGHRDNILVCLLMGLLVLPRIWVRSEDSFSPLFPLNPPAWSLFLELFASALWFPGRRLSTLWLVLVILVSGGVLIPIAYGMGGVQTGWDRATYWIGIIRTIFPFAVGWGIYRVQAYVRLSLPAWLLALVLLAALAVPPMDYTATYDLACVMIVFPLIVLLGHRDPEGWIGKICRFSGEVSYPLYALHWVVWELLLRTFRAMGGKRYPDLFVGVSVVLIIVAVWGVLKLYDEPARRWLKARFTGP